MMGCTLWLVYGEVTDKIKEKRGMNSYYTSSVEETFRFKAENEDLKRYLDVAHQASKCWEEDAGRLEKDLAIEHECVKALRKENEDLKKMSEFRQSVVEGLQKQCDNLRSAQSGVGHTGYVGFYLDLHTKNVEIEKLKKENDELRSTLSALNGNILGLNIKVGELSKENEELKGLGKALKTEAEISWKLRTEVSDLRLKNMALQKENEEIKAKLTQTQQHKDYLVGDNEALRKQIWIMQSWRI